MLKQSVSSTLTQPLDSHGPCPECGANWDAGAIFDTLRPQTWCAEKTDAELQADIDLMYGTDRPQRFSRLIGLSCQTRDRVVGWRCPDCQHTWPLE